MRSMWCRLLFTPVLRYLQKEWLSHLLWEISALNSFVFPIKDWRIRETVIMEVTNVICPNPWLLMVVLLFSCHWLNFETYSFRVQITCDLCAWWESFSKYINQVICWKIYIHHLQGSSCGFLCNLPVEMIQPSCFSVPLQTVKGAELTLPWHSGS